MILSKMNICSNIAPRSSGASENVRKRGFQAIRRRPATSCKNRTCGQGCREFLPPFFAPGLGYLRLLAHIFAMVTLVRTTDIVRLSFLRALLSDSGIHAEVFDENIASLEGGIGAFPRRLVVPPALRVAAENVLRDAEEYYDD